MFCSGEGAEFSPDRCRRDVHAPAPDCRAEQRSRRRPTTANILNSVTSTHFCIHPGAEESVQFRSVLVTRSSPTLCDPLDCSPPGSSGHGILQAGILEWGAIAFSDKEAIELYNCSWFKYLFLCNFMKGNFNFHRKKEI